MLRKNLPKPIGDEIWVNPRYAIARFMGSKVAYKTKDDQPMIFTLKPIEEKGIGKQVQMHLRFEGEDRWNHREDTVDVDAYLPLSECEKMVDWMLDFLIQEVIQH